MAADKLDALLSLTSYPSMPYPAALSVENGVLMVSAVVENQLRKNSVKKSIEQGFQVHIMLGRTPTATETPEAEKVKLHRLGQLLQDLNDDTKFACDATCIGQP
ncbi:hypothetical protein [Ideonella sp. YS5]|uniref:hypothetical protein n=1 Tax=Ideonella sp. YS5 TaxID=3453714 RepID=UPI003EEC6B95